MARFFFMRILCPNCENPVEWGGNEGTNIVCPACGSTFHLELGTTTGWNPSNGKQKLGRFELIEPVGIGAFGTVYKARDTQLDRVVAVKVPRAGNIPTSQEMDRFVREARSVAQLRHPSIVSVHEVGQQQGVPYLVSDFVQGVTLSDQLTAHRPSFREAAKLIASLADAIQHAHDQGVIHRDIKPSNIMIDADGIPYLMDFGLAKRDLGEVTMTIDGQVLGTPAYMSPEQARGEAHRVDGRSDVYSLGVVLYQLLTGVLPFRGNSRMLLHQVLNNEPANPRRIEKDLPRDLETICLRAMSKEPNRRYPSASEFAADLRRFLNGEPIRARPLGFWQRSIKALKRRPLVGAVLLNGLGVITLTGIGIWYYSKVQKSGTERKSSADVEKPPVLQGRPQDALWDHRSIVWWVAFAPKDQTLLATASEDETIKLWRRDGSTWHVEATLRHGAPVRCVMFSPDGATIATGGYDRTVKLWKQVGASWQVSTTLRGQKSFVYALAFAPSGKVLASAGGLWPDPEPGEVKIWDLTSGQALTSLEGHTFNVNGLAFSPDGRLLATNSADRTAKLWDTATWQLVTSFAAPSGGNGVAFAPDSKMLALACGDHSVKLWKWDGSAWQSAPSLVGHEDAVWAVAFSPDGKTLASGSNDGTIALWDTATGERRMILRGHASKVASLAFSIDGNLLASGGFDETLRFWDLTSVTSK